MSDTTPQGGTASATPAAEAKDKSNDKPNGKGRKRLLLFLGISVVILGIGGFCYWFFYARLYSSTDDAFIDAQIVRIAPQVAGQLTEVL
ncbi:EmrA/EmrK family multidrug efflux transporter periplasmic adaptor subunit, partial [Thioclava sp. BHET1]